MISIYGHVVLKWVSILPSRYEYDFYILSCGYKMGFYMVIQV